MLEMMTYTFAGICLYVISDRVLVKIENKLGYEFDNRNLVFFGVLMVLTLSSFAVIRYFLAG